ncbi:unnamed protein product [Phaeothamnion confervicola]
MALRVLLAVLFAFCTRRRVFLEMWVQGSGPGAMVPVCREMLRVFNYKWGDGTDISAYGEGPAGSRRASRRIRCWRRRLILGSAARRCAVPAMRWRRWALVTR